MASTETKKLWNKDFLMFVAGMEFSLVGNNILLFILPLWVLNETGSPVLMGTVLTLSLLPQIIFSPLGGIAADRFRKNRLLALMNLAIVIAIIFYMGISHVMTLVPATVIFMLLLTTFDSMIKPTTDASIPLLVPENDLLKANSAIWMLTIFSTVGSPIIGGFILANLGVTVALFIGIALYGLATIIKFMINIPYTKQEMTDSLPKTIIGDIKDSIRFVTKENIEIGKIHLVTLFVGIFLLPLTTVALPTLVSIYLDMGEATVGVMNGIAMFGGTAGIILIGVLGEKANITKARSMFLVCSIAIIAAGIGVMFSTHAMLTLAVLVISIFAVMVSLTMFAVIAQAYMGEKIPEHLLGKVMALDYTVMGIAMAIGNYIFGFLLNRFISTPGIALLIIAVLATVCSLFIRIKE